MQSLPLRLKATKNKLVCSLHELSKLAEKIGHSCFWHATIVTRSENIELATVCAESFVKCKKCVCGGGATASQQFQLFLSSLH